jgi:hypothetical protein
MDYGIVTEEITSNVIISVKFVSERLSFVSRAGTRIWWAEI